MKESVDWDLIVTSSLNAILCGDRGTIDANLGILRAHLKLPVCEWSRTARAPLPSIQGGTLIVTDLEGATCEEQRTLLAWLDGHAGVRVITLSEGSVFELVTRGELLEQLYYRLNHIYLALSPDCGTHATGTDRRGGAA